MITTPKTLQSSAMSGTIADILSSISDIGKYISTFATGLFPFAGQKTVGWDAAYMFVTPACDTMIASLISQLTTEQIATMATELPLKAKTLLVSHSTGVSASEYNTQVTRYITAFDVEVPARTTDADKVRYTIQLYLMSQLEYMPLSGSANADTEKALVGTKITSLLNELVTGYLNTKGWVGFSAASLFAGNNIYVILGVAALGIGILTSSKHTKVG
jgi:hypothetical protein